MPHIDHFVPSRAPQQPLDEHAPVEPDLSDTPILSEARKGRQRSRHRRDFHVASRSSSTRYCYPQPLPPSPLCPLSSPHFFLASLPPPSALLPAPAQSLPQKLCMSVMRRPQTVSCLHPSSPLSSPLWLPSLPLALCLSLPPDEGLTVRMVWQASALKTRCGGRISL